MDDISQHSLSNASWDNPFGISGSGVGVSSGFETNEQFFGDELKAFFDKEEKMYQSTSSGKSDQSHHITEKSSAMASGITIRSFMVESGDSELINQKLTMSQYLAYKSEPMGHLGDSASDRERPYFSFQERSLQSSNSEKSEPGVVDFDPDFSQEPSWMKKKSLSSLSSSENLDIPSKSPDSSENWLIGTNKSVSSHSLLTSSEMLDASNNRISKEPSVRLSKEKLNYEKSDVSSHSVKEPSIQQLMEKFDSRRSDAKSHNVKGPRRSFDISEVSCVNNQSNHNVKQPTIQQHAEKSSYDTSRVSNLSNHQAKEPNMMQISETSRSSNQSNYQVRRSITQPPIDNVKRDSSRVSNQPKEPSIQQHAEERNLSNHLVKEPSFKIPADKTNQPSMSDVKPVATRHVIHQDFGETSELPSLYWKPHDNESQIDLGQSQMEPEMARAASQCLSYVAGHVESLSLGSDTSRRPSEVAASTRSSSSRASTVRENTDFPRCDSLISEPQLSSTREITDDYTDQSISEKHVHFLPDSRRTEVSHISMEKQTLAFDTLLEPPSKPNLCSTAMTPTGKASEHMMRILANLSSRLETVGADGEEKSRQAASLAKVLQLETTENEMDLQDWQQLERDLTQHDPAGLSPESWIAVFSNTSSLSTPLLVNKIKEHLLRFQGRGMSSDLLPSESSGIGGSGFETTESRVHSAFDAPQTKGPANSSNRPTLSTNVPNISSGISTDQMNPVEEKSVDCSRPSINPMALPASVNINNNIVIDPKPSKNRHTLSVMPPHSVAKPELQTPNECNGNEKNFARLTSTVIKKMPTSDSSKPPLGIAKAKTNLMEQKQHALQVPLVKCNKTQVYFGGARIRQTQKQNLVVRNSSFKEGFELEVRIKDSDAFYLLEADSRLVSRRTIHLDARQECCLDLVFQPHSLGQFSTKLNLYPRCESAKKVKYTVDLFGYGGSSQIQQLIHNSEPDNVLLPKSKGSHWDCNFVLENSGNVPGFALIQPLQEDGTPLEAYQCIVMPQCCSINAGDLKHIQVFIHPPKDEKLSSFKLQVVWGDEPLRSRWIKSISNGTPMKPPPECDGIDWTRLLQINSDESPVQPAVSEEDVALFYNNVRTTEINVIMPDNVKDSRFVTLAVEPATVLEASTVADTMLPQRRMTTAATTTASGRPPSDMSVSAGITELVFPSTKVGLISSEKIPLQNWSGANLEVRVKEISGPFSTKHTRSAVPGGYYTRLPIRFHPTKSGSHSGSVVLDVGQNGQSLTIALRGDAF